MSVNAIIAGYNAELRFVVVASGVPESLHDGLIDFIVRGIPTGSFLEAVLANDLLESFGRADIWNRAKLFEICMFVYNHVPTAACGSYEKVAAWIKSGGLAGHVKGDAEEAKSEDEK